MHNSYSGQIHPGICGSLRMVSLGRHCEVILSTFQKTDVGGSGKRVGVYVLTCPSKRVAWGVYQCIVQVFPVGGMP
jgi:hypothetical protein